MKRKNSAYTKNLINPIVEASLSTNWEEAVLEWDICDCQEDETAQTNCMCGHEGIRYLFYIRNRHNDRTFGPIGSECIKKFGRKDLSSEVDVQERMFRLYDAIRKREFIELNSDFFSRKLLLYLFEQDALDEGGYQFMLDMFNKRDKDSITYGQQRKINAVVGFTLKSYLQRKLSGKYR